MKEIEYIHIIYEFKIDDENKIIMLFSIRHRFTFYNVDKIRLKPEVKNFYGIILFSADSNIYEEQVISSGIFTDQSKIVFFDTTFDVLIMNSIRICKRAR